MFDIWLASARPQAETPSLLERLGISPRDITFNSIKTRLVGLFLLFGILPALCLLGVYFSYKGEIEDAFRRPVKDMAIAIGDVIDRNLFERYGDVQAFGRSASARARENWRNPSFANPLIAAMNGYMTNYGVYRLMVLVDMRGNVLAVNSVDSNGKALDTADIYQMNFATASWFKRAKTGQFLEGRRGMTGTVVEQPTMNPVVGRLYRDDGYTIAFAAPVKNAAGHAIGVWVNFADFGLVEEIVGIFHKILASNNLAESEITVLDAQGRIIVDYDPATHGAVYKRNPRIIGKLNLVEKGVEVAVAAVRGKTGMMLSTHARKRILQASGYAHTTGAYNYPGLGWSVLVRIADTQTAAVSNRVALGMEIAIGIAIAVISILAWLVGRNISESISGMTQAMHTLAGGQKTIVVPSLHRKDEIGVMARALQVFKEQAVEMDRLQIAEKSESRRQLVETNERLEASVRELQLARDAAEAANVAKSAFLASMSHELRTPLNAILGFSDVISKEIMGPIGTSRYREYAMDIHESGMHLLSIINNVLDMAKIGSGKFTLREEHVDVRGLVDSCLRMVRPSADNTRVTLEAVLAQGLSTLWADETRVRQLLINLLSNAVKFTPSGGRVSVHAQVREDGALVLAVVDSGIGMTEEEIRVALQPFRQIDSSLARKYEGTGLGLPLAQGLMQLHGGQLNVTSRPGVGTTVAAIFPAERVRAGHGEAAA